jgi:hypothetical protein
MILQILAISAFLAVSMIDAAAGTWDRSGNDWNQWPPAIQRAYLMGVLDTWNNIETIGKGHIDELKGKDFSGDFYAPLVQCLKTKLLTYEKVHALVQAEFILRPEVKDYALASTIWGVVYKACDQ